MSFDFVKVSNQKIDKSIQDSQNFFYITLNSVKFEKSIGNPVLIKSTVLYRTTKLWQFSRWFHWNQFLCKSRCGFMKIPSCSKAPKKGLNFAAHKRQWWSLNNCMPRHFRSVLERSSRKQNVGFFNPRRDRPKSLKQKVTVPLTNARR